ncbi:MAG: glutamate racemase [Candidatus Omnitrophica bacterium]|nr:glutamate racemase [Candidatus Omnitrophota bacterium]
MRQSPIGVFDSGIGGLTVVKELLRVLPREDLVYFGDTARVPYGTKSKATIVKFSLENVEFLLQHNVKLIIIACNTSSAWALATLKKYFKVPVLGVIRPGAKGAIELTRSRRVGIIGTPSTIRSRAYETELRQLGRGVRVFTQSCPLFVPLVEEGWEEEAVCLAVARRYLQPLLRQRIDTLILGCTHYPLLARVIQRVVGPRVRLVDSARRVALEARDLLEREELLRTAANGVARRRFIVTDEPERFQRLGERFLGHRITNVSKCASPMMAVTA